MTTPLRSLTLRLAAPFCAAMLCAAALSAQGNPQTLRLGTWNLEFLGAEGNFRNNLPPRDDADLAAIGKKIASLGVAVLAVQEICGDAPLVKVTAAAGPTWKFVLGTSGGWDDGKTSQQIGFLYDTARVELLFADELQQLPREIEGTPIFHRVPLTAGFRSRATGFDFRATTVHLKAGRKEQDLQKRRYEAGNLHDWLQALLAAKNEDHDVVLLGDFNSTYGDDPQTLLETGGGMQYLELSPRQPTILHFDDPIDQIVVGKDFEELQSKTFAVHADFGGLSRDAWRKIYSDHLPVTVDLLARGDDDPKATFTRFAAATTQASPEPARARQQPQKARGTGWPPQVGQRIRVRYGTDGDLRNERIAEGSLVEPLPDGQRQHWLVLQTNQGLVGVPFARVIAVDVL